MFYWVAIGLTIISNLFYHLFQKSVSNTVNPIVSLIVTYFSAIIVCFIILPFYPGESNVFGSIKSLNWASFAVGVSIIGLELGFLLAYRAGWNLSSGAAFSNVVVTILLIPVGIFIFKEKLTAVNMLGLVFCIFGLLLANFK